MGGLARLKALMEASEDGVADSPVSFIVEQERFPSDAISEVSASTDVADRRVPSEAISEEWKADAQSALATCEAADRTPQHVHEVAEPCSDEAVCAPRRRRRL